MLRIRRNRLTLIRIMADRDGQTIPSAPLNPVLEPQKQAATSFRLQKYVTHKRSWKTRLNIMGVWPRNTNARRQCFKTQPALVSSLGWDTLEHRRLFNQSVLFYKFHNGLVNCKLPDSATRCSSRSLTRSHHLTYQRPQSNILTHCYSFFPRTLRVWNSLPCEVVTSPSLDSFRLTALPAIRSLKVPSHLRRL